MFKKNKMQQTKKDSLVNNKFFISGCGRSGTTAMAKILNTASNAEVFVEQEPKLCIESRDAYKGMLSDPTETLRNLKEKHIDETINKGLIFGDKNQNYLPFIPYLEKLWKPKYIFMIRDGRDIIRSGIDNRKFMKRGGIFSMNEDDVNSSVTAKEDWWDYSRLRPNIGTEYHEVWQSMDIFEKYCWFWNEYNEVLLENLKKIESERYMLIDISSLTKEKCKEVFDFLGLEGFDPEKIENLISSKVNSLEEKTGKEHVFPHWKDWSAEQNNIFNKHCGVMMKKLGYL